MLYTVSHTVSHLTLFVFAVVQVCGCAGAYRAGCGRGARDECAALQRQRAKCVGFIATGGGEFGRRAVACAVGTCGV